MGLNALDTVDVIEVMENFIEQGRPPEDIRDKLDLSYRIENQSIILYEIRPLHLYPEKIIHSDFAKTTYVKSKDVWKVYWLRGNLKWHLYEPPTVRHLRNLSIL